MSKTYDFPTFKRHVNYRIEARLGLSVYDLPDVISFGDYWHDDCKKSQDDFWNAVDAAVEDILEANGFETYAF